MAQILVIDDDTDIRNVLRLHLEDAGHTVVDAANGRLGIEQIQQRPFDMVITDMVMPEQGGLETIKILRRLQPALKIVAISGGHPRQSNCLHAAKEIGADRILQKPFRKSHFLCLVKECLAP